MRRAFACGLVAGLALAACQGTNLHLEQGRLYSCDRDAGLHVDGGLDPQCPGGYRCGVEGYCYPVHRDAGLPFPCELDADCNDGWRCGAPDKEGNRVCQDQGVAKDYPCVQGQDGWCELGWRCGPEGRCVDPSGDPLPQTVERDAGARRLGPGRLGVTAVWGGLARVNDLLPTATSPAQLASTVLVMDGGTWLAATWFDGNSNQETPDFDGRPLFTVASPPVGAPLAWNGRSLWWTQGATLSSQRLTITGGALRLQAAGNVSLPRTPTGLRASAINDVERLVAFDATSIVEVGANGGVTSLLAPGSGRQLFDVALPLSTCAQSDPAATVAWTNAGLLLGPARTGDGGFFAGPFGAPFPGGPASVELGCRYDEPWVVTADLSVDGGQVRAVRVPQGLGLNAQPQPVFGAACPVGCPAGTSGLAVFTIDGIGSGLMVRGACRGERDGGPALTEWQVLVDAAQQCQLSPRGQSARLAPSARGSALGFVEADQVVRVAANASYGQQGALPLSLGQAPLFMLADDTAMVGSVPGAQGTGRALVAPSDGGAFWRTGAAFSTTQPLAPVDGRPGTWVGAQLDATQGTRSVLLFQGPGAQSPLSHLEAHGDVADGPSVAQFIPGPDGDRWLVTAYDTLFEGLATGGGVPTMSVRVTPLPRQAITSLAFDRSPLADGGVRTAVQGALAAQGRAFRFWAVNDTVWRSEEYGLGDLPAVVGVWSDERGLRAGLRSGQVVSLGSRVTVGEPISGGTSVRQFVRVADQVFALTDQGLFRLVHLPDPLRTDAGVSDAGAPAQPLAHWEPEHRLDAVMPEGAAWTAQGARLQVQGATLYAFSAQGSIGTLVFSP